MIQTMEPAIATEPTLEQQGQVLTNALVRLVTPQISPSQADASVRQLWSAAETAMGLWVQIGSTAVDKANEIPIMEVLGTDQRYVSLRWANRGPCNTCEFRCLEHGVVMYTLWLGGCIAGFDTHAELEQAVAAFMRYARVPPCSYSPVRPAETEDQS